MSAVEDLVMRMRAIGARQAAREVESAATATKRTGTAAKGAGKQFKSAHKEAGLFAGRLKSITGLARNFALVFGVVGIAGALKDSINEAEDWQRVQRQTAAVLGATKFAAGITATEIREMSERIAEATAVADENIQSSANMLLTFRNIKGPKTFERALNAIVATQAAFHKAGKDTTKVPVAIGKALNDPVRGMTALRRLGVAFTDQQVEQAAAMQKSGNMMGAQRVILGELNKEFKAPRPTPWQQLTYTIGELKQSMGIGLLPTVNRVLAAIAKFVTQIRQGRGAGGQFRDVVQRIIGVLGKAWKWIKKNHDLVIVLSSALLGAVAAWKAFLIVSKVIAFMQKAVVAYKLLTGATTAAQAAQMGLNTALLANPVGLVVVAIGALIGVLVIAYLKVKWFRNAVNATFHFIVNFVSHHWKLLLGILLGPFALVILGVIKFRSQIWHVIKTAVGGIVGFFKAIPHGVKGIFNGVVNFFIRRINSLIGIINGAIKAYNKIPLAPNIGTIPKIAQLGGRPKRPGFGGEPGGGGHQRGRPGRAAVPVVPGGDGGRRVGPFRRGGLDRDWSALGGASRADARPSSQQLHATIESPIYLDGRQIGKSVRRASLHAKAVT